MHNVTQGKSRSRNPVKENEGACGDPYEIKQAKKIIQYFGKTFSVMKVYPPENPTVKNSLDIFAVKLKEFLGTYGKMSINIEEFSFLYKNELLLKDEKRQKSLPFLFYKDGMRELTFYAGLDREEILNFMEVLKENSMLPLEESDIVSALWESDFIHIRYFAVDDFLESEAGFLPGKKEFSKGKINLNKKDAEEFLKTSRALGFLADLEEGDEEKNGNILSESLTLSSRIPALKEDEIPEIESMVLSDRKFFPVGELITLLFEILFLEEIYNQFSAILNVIYHCYQEAVQDSDFSLALLILKRLQELKETLTPKSHEKAELLERIYRKAIEDVSLARLKRLYSEGDIKDFDSFIQYMKILGPKTIPLMGMIWEDLKDPGSLSKAVAFLKETGQNDINSLVSIADEQRVSLTREIVRILAEMRDERVICHLENFAGYQDRVIKLEAIRALGNMRNKSANKILIKFLSDDHEDVRITAASSFKYIGKDINIDLLIRLAKDKSFKRKNKVEKKAILNLLAQTKRSEAFAFFKTLLKKRKIFFRSKHNETLICAICALEKTATPEAIKVLEEGALSKKKNVRLACEKSLKHISEVNSIE